VSLSADLPVADNGAGIGASRQTGGTGVAAAIIQLFASTHPARVMR
jgi:hypothetical protein